MIAHTFPSVLNVNAPTYNRVCFLERAYQSLLEQTVHDFEWIIVDDGSKDNIGEVVAAGVLDAPFPIRYVRQENQRKPAAYNHTVRLASGTYLTGLDSDDWLPEESVATQIELMHKYSNRLEICGFAGLCKKSDDKVLGQEFPREGIVESKQHLGKVSPGDKATTFKTRIIKSLPSPLNPGEKSLPESIVYNCIFRSGYQFASTNKILRTNKYQSGGLSNKSLSLCLTSIDGTITHYHEMSLMDFPISLRLQAQSNLTRYSLHKLTPIKFLIRSLLFVPSYMIGILYYIKDQISLRRI